jgi:hypothetical protein
MKGVAGDDDAVGPVPLLRPVADGRDVDGPGDIAPAVADVDADPGIGLARAHRPASLSPGITGIGRPCGFFSRRGRGTAPGVPAPTGSSLLGAAPRRRSSPARLGRRRPAADAQRLRGAAEGEAHELGEEEHRHPVPDPEVAVHRLVEVEVHLAHRADGRDDVTAEPLGGVRGGDDRAEPCIGRDLRQVAATAVRPEREVDHLGAQGADQAVEVAGLLLERPAVVGIRPAHEAAEVGHDAETVERPGDEARHRITADVADDDLEQVADRHRARVVAQPAGSQGIVHLRPQAGVVAQVTVGLGEVDVAQAARRDHGARTLALALGQREVARHEGMCLPGRGRSGTAGAAAVPVLDLVELDAERAADGFERLRVRLAVASIEQPGVVKERRS